MLHSHNHDTYPTIHIYIRKHSQHNNDERTQFFRKIYHSPFIRNGCERVMCERCGGDWTNCSILTPSSFVFISTSFSFYWGAQSGVLRALSPLLGAGSLYSILSPTYWLQLTEPVCHTGLYNCLTSTCCLWASYLHPIQPVHSQGYILWYLRPEALVICTGAFLIWQLGRGSLCYGNTWNHLTECKKNWSTFKNVIYKMCLQIIYIFDICAWTEFSIK